MVFQGTSPVGRSAPMEAILRAAGEATAGGVRTVIVSGEPGIGKAFLVEAVCERAGSPFARILRGCQLAETGDPEAARVLLDAGDILLPPDSARLGMLATVSEAAIAARSDASARWCHEQLLPYSGWLATDGAAFVLGPIDYYLGRLVRALGDVSGGDSYLRRAEEDCLREGLVVWAQRAEAERIGSASRSEVVR